MVITGEDNSRFTMQNKIIIISLLIILVSISSCTLNDDLDLISDSSNIEIGSFSYKEEIEIYDVNKPGGYPGVHFDNFNNNTVSDISNAYDAVKQAKKECNKGLKYDSIDVYHDEDLDMWMVVFYRQGWTGDYCVYMNNQGITTLTVAGE